MLFTNTHQIYFGVMKVRTAGSNVLFAAVTEVSDSVLKGAEAAGLNGMVQIILTYVLCYCFVHRVILKFV